MTSRSSRHRRNARAVAAGFAPGIQTVQDHLRLQAAFDAMLRAQAEGDPRLNELKEAYGEMLHEIKARLRN